MTARWTVHDIPDQTGRVAVITGANTGIGLTTAQALAGREPESSSPSATPTRAGPRPTRSAPPRPPPRSMSRSSTLDRWTRSTMRARPCASGTSASTC